MFLRVFGMFKIGIGPSSSHTMGPMVAAGRFLSRLGADDGLDHVSRVCVRLHGSLAFTGKRHGTDTAVVLGFLGKTPETLDPDAALAMLDGVAASGEFETGWRHRHPIRRRAGHYLRLQFALGGPCQWFGA